MSKYEKIAPRSGGGAEYMLLKETLEKATQGSLSESLEEKVGELVQEIKMAREQREEEIELLRETLQASKEIPVQYLEAYTKSAQNNEVDIASIIQSVSEKPTYTFKLSRDSSGRLSGITATPERGN